MSSKALAVSITACALAASLVAAAGPTRADALSLQKKVDSINAFSTQPANRALRTTLTENEVNAYLTYDANDRLPVGVVEPGVSILGGGRVTARAVVDLDAVRKQRTSRSLLDPLNYVGGRLPMTATGVLTTSNGVARLQFESSAIGPVRVPKLVLQEIVGYYSRSESRPAGIGLDDPFELPARIREIQVETGRAIVVQ